MALSFGRKKGEATDEANNSTTSNGTHDTSPPAPARATPSGAADEGLDESWFDTLESEAAANPLPPTPAAPKLDFVAPSPAPEPNFSVFSAVDEPEDFGDFGTQVDIPAQPASSNNDVFVDPAPSARAAGASTPFDSPPVAAATPIPTKKGGGLKKVVPVLLVLIIVGGGGAFWYSQQAGGEDNDGEAATTQPIGATRTGSAPTTARPTAAPPLAQADLQVKAQLKKLWDEGLALRKQNKNAAAKAKWGAAVRLARSKPGYEKSADMIQQAIDKLK